MGDFILLTALPDTPYFEWQLEVQFLNLTDLGYNLANYHVLVGYLSFVSEPMQELVKRYPDVKWGFYPDTRKETRSYVSTIRPHVIAKHFEVNPWLESERFLLIDTDVIFRDLPDLGSLDNDDTWYFSRTDYISLDRIKGKGAHILGEMCRIVGVEPDLVESQRDNGGAQIWLNGTNALFWNEMEEKCARLYNYLHLTKPIAAKIWSRNSNQPVENYRPLQPYMADMWAMLWSCPLLNKKVRVEPMLDFCSPSDPIDHWDKCFLLHYSLMADCTEPEYFLKRSFKKGVDPDWSDPGVRADVCGRKYIDYLEQMISLRKGVKSFANDLR